MRSTGRNILAWSLPIAALVALVTGGAGCLDVDSLFTEWSDDAFVPPPDLARPSDMTKSPDFAKFPTCTDGVKNGQESDEDCGGPVCKGCQNGLACNNSLDCQSGNCSNHVCLASGPTCNDGVKNGLETGTDCGGGTCPPCALGQGCSLNRDCTSATYCNPTTKVCTTLPAGNCNDGVKNGLESDVDCGGPFCTSKCASGRMCLTGSDCGSGVCLPADGGTNRCQ